MRPIPPGYGGPGSRPGFSRPPGTMSPGISKPSLTPPQARPAGPVPASAPSGAIPSAPTSATNAAAEFILQFKRSLLPYLIQKINPQLLNSGNQQMLRQTIEQLIDEKLSADKVPIGRQLRDKLMADVVNEMVGFGPLEDLLNDETVTEIMVNGPQTIYIEQKGRITLSPIKFVDDASCRRVIDKILSPLGRRVDESSPICDARLPDGSRVNVVVPPCALNGPTITIRKFSKNKLTIDRLIEFKALSKGMAMFLQACVRGALNIVVSGGTGSGKTTLLNALSGFIPEGDRILTIEDAAELALMQPHVVRLEAKPANIEGKGEVSIRDLVKSSLRMRPDRIVIGECRGGEALDMIQAMNTGHDGSLTTTHANTPRDALSRISTLVLMAGVDLPEKAIREQLASAVHLFVQTSRLQDGSRRITHITEVQGMEGQTITLQDLFVFEQTGLTPEGKVKGVLRGNGIIPKCMDKLRAHGENLPVEVFQTVVEVP
ncbi:MAG: CpaF family protein [Candidatus Methylacidiphilales bacterium]|nr:CpaF family protein [Candidatus Methylacidiphilales bacterium]